MLFVIKYCVFRVLWVVNTDVPQGKPHVHGEAMLRRMRKIPSQELVKAGTWIYSYLNIYVLQWWWVFWGDGGSVIYICALKAINV